MNKILLISNIKETATIRFELIADEENLKGSPRVKFINEQLLRIQHDICTADEGMLSRYLDHQVFKLNILKKSIELKKSDTNEYIYENELPSKMFY